MNDQLQKALADIITTLQKGAEQVGTVAQEQVPLLVQEYLAWGFWSAAINAAVCGGILLALLATFLVALRKSRGRWDGQGPTVPIVTFIVSGVLLFALGVPLLIEGIGAGKELVQISIAPRVYLLEQVAALVNR